MVEPNEDRDWTRNRLIVEAEAAARLTVELTEAEREAYRESLLSDPYARPEASRRYVLALAARDMGIERLAALCIRLKDGGLAAFAGSLYSSAIANCRVANDLAHVRLMDELNGGADRAKPERSSDLWQGRRPKDEGPSAPRPELPGVRLALDAGPSLRRAGDGHPVLAEGGGPHGPDRDA